MHQFQLQMIRNREQLNLNHPELSFVLHADGHGDAHDKMATWDKMREGLQPQIFMAWKNFIDEDTPMFDPRQTLGVQPTPLVHQLPVALSLAPIPAVVLDFG